jgi:uncharacterized protein YndB with AHSA1/START domain
LSIIFYYIAVRVNSKKDKSRRTKSDRNKKTIIIDAPADIVFKAITDPAESTNWFPDHAILAQGWRKN